MRFPKLKSVAPKAIQSQIRAPSAIYATTVRLPPLSLELVVEKLASDFELFDFELNLLLSQITNLSQENQKRLKSYVLKRASIEVRTRTMEGILDNFGPAELLDPAFIQSLNELTELAGSFDSKNTIISFLSSPTPVKSLFEAKPESAVDLLLRLNRFGSQSDFSIGQRKISDLLANAKAHHYLFERHFDLLVRFGLGRHFNNWEEVWPELDSILGQHLGASDEWKGSLFNESFGYQKIVDLARNQGLNTTRYKQLSRLIEALRDLNESLRSLSAEVRDRGEYWRKHLKNCSKIEGQKKTGGPYRVAVAFHIGNYVLVELGPTGNALHVYTQAVFDSVRHQDDWRTKSKTVRNLPSYTRDDGTLWHTGGWQYEFDSLVERILNER